MKDNTEISSANRSSQEFWNIIAKNLNNNGPTIKEPDDWKMVHTV